MIKPKIMRDERSLEHLFTAKEYWREYNKINGGGSYKITRLKYLRGKKIIKRITALLIIKRKPIKNKEIRYDNSMPS